MISFIELRKIKDNIRKRPPLNNEDKKAIYEFYKYHKDGEKLAAAQWKAEKKYWRTRGSKICWDIDEDNSIWTIEEKK